MQWAVKVNSVGNEVISLAEAKLHLRVDHNTEDDLISALITAAREHVEKYLNLAVVEKSLTLYLDAFPSGNVIELPYSNLIGIDSVKYRDGSGALQTWDPSNYTEDTASNPGRLIKAYNVSWPNTLGHPQAVEITYTAGYGGSPPEVPQPIIAAMMLVIGDLYEHREAVKDTQSYVNPTVDRLLHFYRVGLGI